MNLDILTYTYQIYYKIKLTFWFPQVGVIVTGKIQILILILKYLFGKFLEIDSSN